MSLLGRQSLEEPKLSDLIRSAIVLLRLRACDVTEIRRCVGETGTIRSATRGDRLRLGRSELLRYAGTRLGSSIGRNRAVADAMQSEWPFGRPRVSGIGSDGDFDAESVH